MKTIQKMYEHLNWANKRIFEALQSMEEESQEIWRLFSHTLNAEKIWITRLCEEDSTQLPIWSDADKELCGELMKQNEESYTAFLTNLEHTDLDKIISYINSKGNPFKYSVRDILTHVALHGQYHRGQINSRLRAGGVEPVSTDYIIFAK